MCHISLPFKVAIYIVGTGGHPAEIALPSGPFPLQQCADTGAGLWERTGHSCSTFSYRNSDASLSLYSGTERCLI